MTRSLRLRLIAATLIIAAAPLLFLGLSMLTAERRAAEGQRHTTAAVYAARELLLAVPGPIDLLQARALIEPVAAQHRVRITVIDPERHTAQTDDHDHPPSRTLDRISYGSAGPPTLKRLESARTSIFSRTEVQRALTDPTAGVLPYCTEPMRAASGPTVCVCISVLGVAARGAPGRWVLFAEQVVRRPLLAETQVQLKVLTVYVVVIALLPLGWWLGWGVLRPLDKLRAQVQQHAAQPLSMPQVHVEGQGEIAELADAFNGLLRALAERVRQNEEFMANVAHEMKNPVAAIRAAAEALGRPETLDEARARRLSRVLLQSSQKLDALVTRFLDLARAEAGLPNEERVAIFLPDLIGRLVEQLRADERYHTVRFEIDAQPLSVSGVPGRIESVFGNLLDNAASFAPARPAGSEDAASPDASEAPWVRVRIRRDPDRPLAIIDVTDSGPGIAPEDLKQLFKRFFTRRPRGSGIGLVLSRSLVEAHGGSLIASSLPGHGATFTVRLPLLENAAAAAPGRSGGFKPITV
jgi:two-component system sensor histidine kinase ChvG